MSTAGDRAGSSRPFTPGAGVTTTGGDTEPGAADSGRFTPIPTPLGLERASTGGDDGRKQLRRREALRTVVYLMLFRVGLATLLLGALVAVALANGSAETLTGPSGRFALTLLVGTYVVSLVYGLVVKRVTDLVRFAYVQMGVDLLFVTVLVHGTGGVQSGFHFLYLIDIVAVALLPARRGVLWVSLAAGGALTLVSLAGYLQWLPELPGQTLAPWDVSRRELLFRLVLNLAGVAAVGALGLSLAAQSREAGEKLQRHEQYAGDLASLHENTIRCLSSGLVTVDRGGVITSVNEAACEILGITRRAGVGQPLAMRVPGLSALLDEVGLVGNVRRQEVDAVRPDGAVRRLGVSATPLSDHTGRVIGRVIHFQDLTELRRMEVAVARSERLASIGRLAAGVAHEIRNPLASISGSVEVLRTLPEADGDAKKLIDITVREVDRLNELISALLDYARPPSQERSPILLTELVEEVVRAFRSGQPDGKVEVVLDAEPDVTVQGAAGQLRQVLWNLLRNAEEAMPTGGRVQVSLSQDELTSGQREAVLTVSDAGIGISPGDQEHIFEPFFTKGKKGGTGLGLATVARAVEDHRGTIEVQSAPGRGTTIMVRLPLARPASASPPAPPRVQRPAA